MKFTTSAALVALTSALFVAAAPVAEPAAASPSVQAGDGMTELDLGNPSLLAAVLDPTFVDANSNDDDGVMSINNVNVATSSPVAAKVAATPVIMNLQTFGGARVLLPTPVIRPIAKVSDQVAAPSKVQAAAGGASAYVSPVVVTIPGKTKTVTSIRTQNPIGQATVVKTITNTNTPKPVVVSIPGRTSTFYSTRYYTPSPIAPLKPSIPSAKSILPVAPIAQNTRKPIGPAAISSIKSAVVSQAPAFVNKPNISMVTVTRQSSTLVVVTIPGKMSTTTIKSYYNQWKVRPAVQTTSRN